MGIPKEAYEILQSIVGPEWVSDDQAICAADTKGGCETGIMDATAIRPACSIQPASTEEVREIVKVANRYRLPYVPTSTFFTAACAPHRENTIMMDLKRMDKFEINERDLYAIVEPGVTFSMLQVELFKRGLFTFVTGAGSQSSTVANNIFCGDAPMGWRHGLGYRRILATEWVLPDGEILKLGTLATSDEYFWGEGPGPDLRSILRGNRGYAGGLGTVTKLAMKIFSFIPERPVPEGIGPHATLHLPENKMMWYNARFPTLEQLVDAVYELGKCEIGLVVMHIDPIFGYVARARGQSANVFWEEWHKAKQTIDVNQGWLRVLLCGFTSEKQVAYEEKVLQDVVAAHGGTARRSRPFDETNLQSSDAISANLTGGRFLSVLYFESVDHALRLGRENAEIRKKYVPPLVDTYGLPGWYVPYDFAHCCKEETLIQGDVEDTEILGKLGEECKQNDIKIGAYPWPEDPGVFGPYFYNYAKKLESLKELLDPNNVSNPPKPVRSE